MPEDKWRRWSSVSWSKDACGHNGWATCLVNVTSRRSVLFAVSLLRYTSSFCEFSLRLAYALITTAVDGKLTVQHIFDENRCLNQNMKHFAVIWNLCRDRIWIVTAIIIHDYINVVFTHAYRYCVHVLSVHAIRVRACEHRLNAVSRETTVREYVNGLDWTCGGWKEQSMLIYVCSTN